MNKFGKFLFAAIAQIVAIAVLAGSNTSLPTTICHFTGDGVAPYQEIRITQADMNEHLSHVNDLIPAPAAGCPGTK